MNEKPFIIRALSFIRRNGLKNPLYTLAYGLIYFLPKFSSGVTFYSNKEIQELIENGKSIIRYGDGEVRLMNYGSLAFQKYEPDIRKTLFESIKQYSPSSPYIIGVNDLAMNRTNTELRAEGSFQLHMSIRVYFSLLFPKKMKYMDASFFYYNENVREYFAPVLSKKEIIFCSRAKTLDEIKNNPRFPYIKHSHFIETKESDAFDDYVKICRKIDEIIQNLPAKTRVLIIAGFGAGSKTLAYEYSAKGIQVLDIGTGIEILYQERRIDGILKPKDNK